MPEQQKPGAPLLTEILSDAVANGADAIELERDSDGSLEVMFRGGNSGSGFGLSCDEGQELIDSIYEAKRRSRGKFRISLHGKDYLVQVKPGSGLRPGQP